MTEAADDKLTKLQMAGANARAIGASFLDNPYLKLETLPANSGDTREQWEEKHDAWHLGWTIEDAIRA